MLQLDLAHDHDVEMLQLDLVGNNRGDGIWWKTILRRGCLQNIQSQVYFKFLM